MPIVQHSNFQHADAHEPRHVTLNGTGASGKVITNSGSVTQTSEYRNLVLSEVNEVDEIVVVLELDSTSAQTHYVAVPFQGTIIKWVAVTSNPLVTGNNTYELRIDGVAVTSTQITFTTGGASGDQESAAASGANGFSVGQNIEVVGTSISNTDATVDIRFTITIRR